MAKAHEIMVDHVITVNENDTVNEVLKVFVKYRISGIPIIDVNKEPIGYISDGDIMNYICQHDPIMFFSDITTYITPWIESESFEEKIKELNELNVLKIATKRVITVQHDEEIDVIAKILGNKKIKKVPVVKDNKLVGIISRGDIIRYIVKNYLEA